MLAIEKTSINIEDGSTSIKTRLIVVIFAMQM